MRSRKRRRRAAMAVLAAVLVGVVVFVVWQRRPSPPPSPRPAPAAQRRAPKAPPKPAAPEPKAPEPAKPATARREPAKPLPNPPEIVKGVYFTSWSAGLRKRIDYLVELRRTTGMNAVVIDIKDYSGYLAYRAALPEAARYGAIRPTVRDIDALIDRLHQAGIYVIARITVFQDPILAVARPDLAVHSLARLGDPKNPRTAASLWLDRKGLAWIDPASHSAWDYNIAIAKDAASHGFDELNFDYVRFPSDGNLKDMQFPSWNGKTPKHQVLREFFARLRKELAGSRISADLFGLATVNADDLGIGQVIEDGYQGFDFVCPMVYPSHYARGFLGRPNPAEYPYEVVNYSISSAFDRLEALTLKNGADSRGNGAPPLARLRPWLQDFNLGAKYDAAMVKAQIKAVEDALGDQFAGFLLWSSSNVYTRAALE